MEEQKVSKFSMMLDELLDAFPAVGEHVDAIKDILLSDEGEPAAEPIEGEGIPESEEAPQEYDEAFFMDEESEEPMPLEDEEELPPKK